MCGFPRTRHSDQRATPLVEVAKPRPTTPMTLQLPAEDGTLTRWRPSGTVLPPPEPGGFSARVALAATHVVADPSPDLTGDGTAHLDWEATLAYRHHVWSLGLGVAEAMDTAQRGAGLTWEASRELMRRTGAEAASVGGLAVFGAGTDQLPASPSTQPKILEAYREQLELIESLRGGAVVMASRALAHMARSPDDYLDVYTTLLADVARPVIIHWLGDMFDPELHGYWGSTDLWAAMETVIELARICGRQIDGVKVSVLDDSLERQLRRALPAGVRVYTGDDLNFVDLVAGDGDHHSDALLGAFDPIAPAAALALQALDRGDVARYREVLEPTIPLSRHLFAPPRSHYKAGVVFLAYLNGHQEHFRMLSGAESMRSLTHLSRLLVLADEAGLLRDPPLAVHRMRLQLAAAGID